ncbi:hypothetical protein JTB14_033865 [Gonioctena quinquepunctata]|nr:hypothetical protein JTB14_033865 [Gonioctena quinquepunctata]
MTRAQISSKIESETKKPENGIKTQLEFPLPDNVNRIQREEEGASSVGEAIALLGKEKIVDKHPERRMKAAYAAFENKRLEELKKDNNGLRLSQLKEMVFKEWQKSSENPLNRQVV